MTGQYLLMTKTLAASLSVALLASSVQAQSLKEKYELSERCGKLAAEAFKKEWEAGAHISNFGTIGNYENHYNSRLNKCFYLEIANNYGKFKMLRLFDLHENREIGSYTENGVVLCKVQEQKCRTQQEWRALIKPFMED